MEADALPVPLPGPRSGTAADLRRELLLHDRHAALAALARAQLVRKLAEAEDREAAGAALPPPIPRG